MVFVRRVAAICCAGVIAIAGGSFANLNTAYGQAPPPPPEQGLAPILPPPSPNQVAPVQPEANTPTVPAQSTPGNSSLSALGSCVASKGQLDVILMIDETESLIHQVKDGNIDPNTPGADASHNRVPAAQSFVNQLLAKHNSEGVDVRIRVAGFGQEYKNGFSDPVYGEWVQLDDQSIKGVKNTIAGFADRTSEQYTNYANAFAGAYQDFPRSGATDSCKMLVTFTDGALTAQEGQEVAQDAVCRPNGITDQFRSAGITNIGIGLSDPKNPSNFELFAGITEGTGTRCGTLDPNGAFFPADSVGSLFASFHQALGNGGVYSEETAASDPFEFVLDDSVDSVRFTALAKDDLGPNAKLNLIAPDGSKLVLDGEGSSSVGGAEVTWAASHDPVQQADGEMKLKKPGGWAGAWRLQFEGFGEDRSDHKVFNSVKIQPDLQIQFHGPEGPATSNLSARSNEEIALSLVGLDRQPRKLQGDAKINLDFVPADGGSRVDLLSGVDVSKGKEAKVQLDTLANLPTSGTLEASVNIVTAGPNGRPGTALEPVTNQIDIAVSRQDMPVVPGAVSFTMEAPEVTVPIAVTGPGKVWVPAGSTLETEILPEGIDAIQLSSEHTDAASALTLSEGEQATLPVKVSVAQLRDGVVTGSIPVSLARADGSEETTVPVQATGNLSVPLNKTAFTLAFLAAVLLGLLIPLGLLYLVRFLTARIPQQYFGAQRIALSFEGASVRYDGAPAPTIDLDQASRNQVLHDGRSADVLGYRLRVRSFHWNPLAESKVVVESAPSVGASGKQLHGQAVLPLAVQGEWFIAAAHGQLELIVLPRLPIDQQSARSLEEAITDRVPELAVRIQQTLDQQRSTQPPEPAGGTPTAAASTSESWDQPASSWGTSWDGKTNNQSDPGWGEAPKWN
ncbi:hypothetical protein CFREI_12280 [Corynebacterium freiburgense]|nr:hypothetical protein CFREI_12280 [Corynebacterium freiburgense]